MRIGGKDHHLGPYGSPESRDRYDELIGVANVEAAEASTTPTTVNQLCLAYYRHAKTYYSRDGKPTSEVDAIRVTLNRLVSTVNASGRTTYTFDDDGTSRRSRRLQATAPVARSSLLGSQGHPG